MRTDQFIWYSQLFKRSFIDILGSFMKVLSRIKSGQWFCFVRNTPGTIALILICPPYLNPISLANHLVYPSMAEVFATIQPKLRVISLFAARGEILMIVPDPLITIAFLKTWGDSIVPQRFSSIALCVYSIFKSKKPLSCSAINPAMLLTAAFTNPPIRLHLSQLFSLTHISRFSSKTSVRK